MALYEMVREIMNECSGNQMRDIFFDELEIEDPVEKVREILKNESKMELTVEVKNSETTIVYANCSGVVQRFMFTRI